MKTIKLHDGSVALIDDVMFNRVSYFVWYPRKDRNTIYAETTLKLSNGKWRAIRMHKLITNFSKVIIDHKDGNGLNNQMNNLRIVNLSQNQWNRKKVSKASSRYKGVSWNKKGKKWQAYIRFNRKMKSIGYFKDEKDAAVAYNNEAIKLFGEYAKINIIT